MHVTVLRCALVISVLSLAAACGDDDASAVDAAPSVDASQPGPDADPLGCTMRLAPGADDQTSVQTALIEATSGSTICFLPGTYTFTGELSLSTAGITMLGTDDGVVFDFSGQTSGANGVAVTGDDFTFDRISIQDTPGDGLRITDTTGLVIRNASVVWTGGPSTDNGAYGLYPVGVTGVLIEDSLVSGAADAGFYVGQSTDIVVRRNEATLNVAGIEIENSTNAEVYDNHAHDNTGGILAFALPEVPKPDCNRVLIHDNVIENNNTDNFADPSATVAIVPPGTGMLIVAADNVEVRNNTITGNDSTGIVTVSYGILMKAFNDPDYDPWTETIWIHDNTFSGNGANPAGFFLIAGQPTLEDVLWDGLVDPDKDNTDGSLSYCVSALGGTFRMINAAGGFENQVTDPTDYTCEHDPLPPVNP